jgi:DNA-binding transcriptional ArsR family regulator
MGPSPPDVVEVAARRLRVMGHPVRLRLIEVLANGPQSVTELAAALGIEHQLISKHLNELHRCDVVTRRQDGNFAVYSLPDALTLKAVALVCRSVLEDRTRLARVATEARSDGDGPNA